MGLTIYQINVRNWKKIQYTISIDLPNYSPDILLLNETGLDPLDEPKLLGFNTICKSQGQFTGVAILIKKQLQFEIIPVEDDNTLAVKLNTDLGPLIVATSYCPPRFDYIPTTSIYTILRHNLPTVFIGDYNAHYPLFDNCVAGQPRGDLRGRILNNVIKTNLMTFIGPYFSTYIVNQKRGKPDLIFANKLFAPYHHITEAGTFLGSDHIPIIFKISLKPFKIPVTPSSNTNKINIKEYQKSLSQIPVPDLDNKPITELDNVTNSLMSNIIDASTKHCPKTTVVPIQQYLPTPKLKRLLQQYRSASFNLYRFGSPNRTKLNELLNNLIKEVLKDKSDKWKKVVDEAINHYGNPKAFWAKVNSLLSKKSRKATLQLNKLNNDGSISKIVNKQEMANLMSESWEAIFQEHTGPEFQNPNVDKINDWYSNILPSLQYSNTIHFNSLIPDHPLIRPLTTPEISNAIKQTKNKAPGLSGIRQIHLANLPHNCILILEQIYNSILSTQYFPLTLHHIKMIFLEKPGKSKLDPRNYRPICLIEIILKIFEKIIAQRFNYYLEHNNLLTERQFGFRTDRGTQHSITLIKTAVQENTKQGYTTIVATRDVENAFDTVWFKGLLYKVNLLPNIETSFLTLVHQFLINRVIHPYFQDIEGDPFVPRAGVPQGSSWGPGLFNVLVNDHPQPIYKTTLITQFADDFIHTVRSSTKNKRKNLDAKNKLLKELKQTKVWECQWKIKSNTNKISLGVFGTTTQQFQKLGPLTIDNTIIPIKTIIKILGYNISRNSFSGAHIDIITTRAKLQLTKLQRFYNAPPKIKTILYKSLIRPLLDYPSIPIALTNKTNKIKLQKVQNRALRFINSSYLRDKIKMSTLHDKYKIDAYNIRIHKLAKKCLNTLICNYSPNSDLNPIKKYKYSNYINENEPLKNRKRPLIQRINKYLAQKKKCILYELNKTNGWPEPSPMYT